MKIANPAKRKSDWLVAARTSNAEIFKTQSHRAHGVPTLGLLWKAKRGRSSLIAITEWNPPYDLRDKKSIKAQNIAAAIDALSNELAIPADRVVPVCLRLGEIHNVNESLIPLVVHVLPDAQRSKLLRLLREFHDSEYWSQLFHQAYNSGRLLRKVAASLAFPLLNEVIKLVAKDR